MTKLLSTIERRSPEKDLHDSYFILNNRLTKVAHCVALLCSVFVLVFVVVIIFLLPAMPSQSSTPRNSGEVVFSLWRKFHVCRNPADWCLHVVQKNWASSIFSENGCD
jgi:hypothetical protein